MVKIKLVKKFFWDDVNPDFRPLFMIYTIGPIMGLLALIVVLWLSKLMRM